MISFIFFYRKLEQWAYNLRTIYTASGIIQFIQSNHLYISQVLYSLFNPIIYIFLRYYTVYLIQSFIYFLRNGWNMLKKEMDYFKIFLFYICEVILCYFKSLKGTVFLSFNLYMFWTFNMFWTFYITQYESC